jgi:trans-aconitate 2-methyltransferase
MSATWDPVVYERYKAYRDRPALDLMVQMPAELAPGEIWDLGCGTGEHAALLARRHPRAKVHGLDSSAEMLAAARARPGSIDWVQGDIAGFHPEVPPDLVFTNAALQWLPGLASLVPRLVAELAPFGVFACQVPLSYEAGWYEALRQVAADPRWAERLANVQGVRPIAAAQDWHGWLAPLCSSIDIWTTTYLHALEGDDPIVDWMSGTGLRPYLQAFGDEAERLAFIDAYRRRVSALYPRGADGMTLFPFPRLFVIARRA